MRAHIRTAKLVPLHNKGGRSEVNKRMWTPSKKWNLWWLCRNSDSLSILRDSDSVVRRVASGSSSLWKVAKKASYAFRERGNGAETTCTRKEEETNQNLTWRQRRSLFGGCRSGATSGPAGSAASSASSSGTPSTHWRFLTYFMLTMSAKFG